MSKHTRRQFLGNMALGTAGLAAGAGLSCTTANGRPRMNPLPRDEGFYFVHLTDQHVRRKRRGDEGYRACVASVNALQPRPSFVLMGGDMAFDGLYTERDEFEDQIQLYKSISDTLRMPYYNCLGNHDLLGLSARRKVPVDDPEIGHKMILDRLGMENSYYSFDHGDWHFVVLDSMEHVETSSGPTYRGQISEEQLNWLALDLAKAGDRPTMCVQHIAAFNNLAQVWNDFDLPAMYTRYVIRNNRDLREMLQRHKVKALLQGHSHRGEDYRYKNVWYITSPSASGAWWGGNWHGDSTGYTVLHCVGDRFTWETRYFDWEHHLEPEDDLERERIAEREAHEEEQRRLLAEEMAAAEALQESR